ncbi:methyltransferase [Microbacterium sp. MPKO10]|uniref:methyltransferase n=1 Tax=Microbacterium sp. MPKO10 TaxID=2989818 RepID=UPI0022354CF4|nr:methyltransferase [Microbacterium sp. MPKO10]MCW4458590.1 methyltransferase [Microbacterium sp. MPKO10]
MSATDAEPSGWQRLAPLIDLVTPMAMRVAATFALADELRDGPLRADELARRVGANDEALERMMRHLVTHGVFVEPERGVFGTNSLAALLDSDHPSGMRENLDLSGFGGQMDLVFTELMHTVLTGEPAWQTMFGAPFWEHVTESPTLNASFDRVMSSGSEYVSDDVASFEWSRARHIVDVGGGTGRLIAALLRQHPGMTATLIDLPATVERGRMFLHDQGVADRVRYVAQSFFEPLPGEGDVYVLNSILHDWNDEHAVEILRRCADAAGREGRVVIIENDTAARAEHAEMDLRMLVLCGGRERTIAEFEQCAHAAGLAMVATRSTPLGQIGIELCAQGEHGGR